MAEEKLTKAGKLRKMLNGGGLIKAPGAYDVWSAKLVEEAGFDAVYMTGYGVSASVLGKPDIGIMTFSEVAAMARNMARALNIPLIADCDTGFGTSLNVIRCVREFEEAGVAAIQFEDQVMPKRCGHMEGKELIPKEDMVQKLKAAVYARKDPDFVIIARTDARAVNGMDDAIERANAYVEAGADVIFLEAPREKEEIIRAAKEIKAPLLSNMVENGKTPLMTMDELSELGYQIVIYPVTTIYTVTKAILDNLAILKETGGIADCMEYSVGFPDFNRMIGLAEERALEKSFME
ncbi:MAG: isocitrate lyase/phosphoenolpyruvate mutase family protein [Solobacterium sp.]|nr:isocitrate lyase/phosphoenolpyruvate mutase family protein [Solobacterium sp.]